MSFIALIPKKVGAVDVKYFWPVRPISLINGVYRIILKVLANCMNTVMSSIISKCICEGETNFVFGIDSQRTLGLYNQGGHTQAFVQVRHGKDL